MHLTRLPQLRALLLVLLLASALAACVKASPETGGEGEAAQEPGAEGRSETTGGVPAEDASGEAVAKGSTRVSEEGNVRIEVAWRDASQLLFQVTMYTHSVDLDGYDLLELASLRTASGEEIAPSGWDAPPGGHHRSGTLTFPTTDVAGNPIPGERPGALEIIIRDVAEVPERRFRWDYQSAIHR